MRIKLFITQLFIKAQALSVMSDNHWQAIAYTLQCENGAERESKKEHNHSIKKIKSKT
jgi:hypothetical protein